MCVTRVLSTVMDVKPAANCSSSDVGSLIKMPLIKMQGNYALVCLGFHMHINVNTFQTVKMLKSLAV